MEKMNEKLKRKKEEEEYYTHERSLEHMLGRENLIGWIKSSGINGSALDLEHTVDAREEDNENGGADGFDDDGATTALDAIEDHDYELTERRLEEEKQYEHHFGEDQGVKEVDHRRRELNPRSERKDYLSAFFFSFLLLFSVGSIDWPLSDRPAHI